MIHVYMPIFQSESEFRVFKCDKGHHGCMSVAQGGLDAYRRFLSDVTIFPVPARVLCADNAARA